MSNAFKFRQLDLNSISALNSNQLWFSDSYNLNDPFEFYVTEKQYDENERFTHNIKEYKKSLISQGEKAHKAEDLVMGLYQRDARKANLFIENELKRLTNESKAYLRSLNICSMSHTRSGQEETILRNMLMWGHYANGFNGFCIEFDTQTLTDSIECLNDTKIGTTPVEYTNRPQQVDRYLGLEQYSVDILRSLRFKHTQWEYEQELRLVSSKKGLHRYSPESLKAVYIGGNMGKENRSLLLSVIRSLGVKIDVENITVAEDNEDFALKRNRLINSCSDL